MWSKIISFIGGSSIEWGLLFAVFGGFFSGCLCGMWLTEWELKEFKAATESALAAQQAKNKKGLSDATNTILTAQEQYASVVSERDALIERLRKLNESSLRKAGNSCEAIAKRAATCERVASGLLDLSKRCGEGWQACAIRKDALAEAVK